MPTMFFLGGEIPDGILWPEQWSPLTFRGITDNRYGWQNKRAFMWSQRGCTLQMRAGSERYRHSHRFKHFIAPKWLSNATHWIGSNDWVTCGQLTQSNTCLNDRCLTRSQSPPQSPETLAQLFDIYNMSSKASFKWPVWTRMNLSETQTDGFLTPIHNENKWTEHFSHRRW